MYKCSFSTISKPQALCQGHDSNQLSKAKKKEGKKIILYIQLNLCREREILIFAFKSMLQQSFAKHM